MKIYELTPTDGRKSFYRKASVQVNGDVETLISYNTPVLSKNTKTGELVRLWGGWSTTTGRHIKAFAGLSKAEYMKLPHKITPAEKTAAYSDTLYKEIIRNSINIKAIRRAEQILEEISGKRFFFLFEEETTTELSDDSIDFDITAKGMGHTFRIHGYVDRWGDVNACVLWLGVEGNADRLLWDCVTGVNEKEAPYIKAIA